MGLWLRHQGWFSADRACRCLQVLRLSGGAGSRRTSTVVITRVSFPPCYRWWLAAFIIMSTGQEGTVVAAARGRRHRPASRRREYGRRGGSRVEQDVT